MFSTTIKVLNVIIVVNNISSVFATMSRYVYTDNWWLADYFQFVIIVIIDYGLAVFFIMSVVAT